MPTDVRLGTELAGYRLESVIGRSLMSVVYLAEHLRLGRKVALKVLAPELNEDPAFRDRFIRESQLAASLDHPHVIQIYDAGEADGLLYLAMRYVSGPDLARLIRSEGPLAPERTLSFLGQIGGALDAAHAAGLVHRDVKPGNILIERAPDPQGPEICYLADFGLTRQLSSLAGLTDPGTFVGTVDFAAPEIIEGRAIDGRVDVYSIGCVLYQCLTGSVPFPRESDIAVTHAHLEDPRPSVTTLRPEFPPSIDQVVATAMARRKDDRFSSCGALMEAARASLVPSGDGHPTPESKRTVKRGRGMMARSSWGSGAEARGSGSCSLDSPSLQGPGSLSHSCSFAARRRRLQAGPSSGR